MPNSLLIGLRRLGALTLALQLAACAHSSSSTPQLDPRFGDAVRLAMAQQVRDPASADNRQPADGLDGPSAHAVMQRYRASFAEPNGQAPQPVQFMLGGANGK
ncbi:hypothetical protein [Janthinobacterium sp. FW305-128]|uniref:hypothetical protein n=1 Tax=Janthinobacterium sp. FW305-128 TaxID=2775055 RepID=UPI001E4E448A|nr:hypothetical protein [Janthinobacterium sp. FW305-128]MCC7681348.1 hypothetical protein [Janthinobacterium sp. FW305-128]